LQREANSCKAENSQPNGLYVSNLVLFFKKKNFFSNARNDFFSVGHLPRKFHVPDTEKDKTGLE